MPPEDDHVIAALKLERTNALSAVTRLRNQIRAVTARETPTPDEAATLLAELGNRLEVYRQSHLAVAAVASDQREEVRYLDNEDQIHGFQRRIQAWLEVHTHPRTPSQSGGERSIASSGSHGSLEQERSKLSGLIARKNQGAARRRMMELQLEQQELEMEMEIAESEARLRALADDDGGFRLAQGEMVDQVLKTPRAPSEIPEDIKPVVKQPASLASSRGRRRLPALPPQASLPAQPTQSPQVLSELLSTLNLPKPEVPRFAGEVTMYHQFMYAFDCRVGQRSMSSRDKLHYLIQYLDGIPKELVSSCLYLVPEEGYSEARRLLQAEYGDSYKIASAFVSKLQSWPQIKPSDGTSIREFSLFLVRCRNVMSSQEISDLSVLNHAPNMKACVSKLPPFLQGKWRDRASKARAKGVVLHFSDLVAFVKEASDAANDAIYGITEKAQGNLSSNTKPKLNVAAVSVKAKRPVAKCAYCLGAHATANCAKLKAIELSQRREFVKSNNLCFGCLDQGHRVQQCHKRRRCETCGRMHPTWLHRQSGGTEPDKQAGVPLSAQDQGQLAPEEISHENSARIQCTNSVVHSIVPVLVRQGDRQSIPTYAFLDTGSSGSFMSASLVEKICPESEWRQISLTTINGTSLQETKAIRGLVLSDMKGRNEVELPLVYERDLIPASLDQIPRPEMLRHWSHLRNVADATPPVRTDLEIGLLIGCNVPRALEPLEVVAGESSMAPIAMRTRFGWTAIGPTLTSVNGSFISCQRIAIQETEVSKELVIKALERDFEEYRDGSGGVGMSIEDRKFLRIMEEGVEIDEEKHYVLPLPFRDPSPTLPSNFEQAHSRALRQRVKMLKDAKYREHYAAFMGKIFAKGYAREAPDGLDVGNAWYLPHHGVYHPRKPGKLRVVFDCSAKHAGVALNDVLLDRI